MRQQYKKQKGARLAAAFLFVAACLVARQASAAQGATLPDRHQAVQLIRSTLSAIDDATLTSNYSVLHALGAPEFRVKFSIEQLAATCSLLRQRHVDLSPDSAIEPIIEDGRVSDDLDVVQFRGQIPGAVNVRFQFSYQYVQGRWRLYGFDLTLLPSGRHIGSATGQAL